MLPLRLIFVVAHDNHWGGKKTKKKRRNTIKLNVAICLFRQKMILSIQMPSLVGATLGIRCGYIPSEKSLKNEDKKRENAFEFCLT